MFSKREFLTSNITTTTKNGANYADCNFKTITEDGLYLMIVTVLGTANSSINGTITKNGVGIDYASMTANSTSTNYSALAEIIAIEELTVGDVIGLNLICSSSLSNRIQRCLLIKIK